MENPKFTKFLAFCQNDGLFSAFYALQKQTLSINVWKLREFWIFNFETIILNLEKVFSNLEPEGQGGGIIMGVTRLLLLGPFYYIQTNFSILFCTRLYVRKLMQSLKRYFPWDEYCYRYYILLSHKIKLCMEVLTNLMQNMQKYPKNRALHT